jgi:hypothetical protein
VFSEHGPHVGDVHLNRHREHRRALFPIRAAAAEGLADRLRPPALEDIDAAPGRADRRRSRIETASSPASLFGDAHPAREVGLALLWSSKTGTLLNLRHELGVVEHADDQRVAVAALTDSTVPAAVQPAAEARMALVARRLHDELCAR